MSAPGVRVGVMLPTFRESPEDALSLGREAEEAGIDGVFLYDHLWPMGRPDRPALAPFPLLGALAAATNRLMVGTLVARVGLVPDEVLVAEFAALGALAPGRVVAAVGTGDDLSFNENLAYGVAPGSAAERRQAAERVARALIELGMEVWVGGTARPTVAVAERAGAAANFWQCPPERVAEQAARSLVTWAGMADPDGGSEDLDAAALLEIARPYVRSGASWVVFGWPVRLAELASAADRLRGDEAMGA